MGFSWPKVKEIIMDKENKKVTRRKFLEDSSKKALAGSAAAFLGLGMIKPKAVQAAGCWWFCSGACSNSCSGHCNIVCESGCTTSCTGTCKTSCNMACTSACTQDCEQTCNDSGRSVSTAEATCGSCVSEREASTRHVIV